MVDDPSSIPHVRQKMMELPFYLIVLLAECYRITVTSERTGLVYQDAIDVGFVNHRSIPS